MPAAQPDASLHLAGSVPSTLVSFSTPRCPVLHTMAYVTAEARVDAEPGAQVWVDGRAASVTIPISLGSCYRFPTTRKLMTRKLMIAAPG